MHGGNLKLLICVCFVAQNADCFSLATETVTYRQHCGQSEITGCCCQLDALMGHSAQSLLCQADV